MSETSRVRRSATEWRKIVAEYEASGLSRAAFGKGAGIAPSTLHLWQRRLRQPDVGGAFIEVTPSQLPAARWVVEFAFPDGTTARVQG